MLFIEIIENLNAVLALCTISGLLFASLLFKSLFVLYRYKNVPGPRPRLPLFGNLNMAYQPQIPLPKFTRVMLNKIAADHRKDGMALLFRGCDVILGLFKAEYAAEFLNDKNLINKADEYKVTRRWLGEGILTVNGTKWKNKRRLITPVFHSKILEENVDRMNEQTAKLIEKLSEELRKPFVDIRSLMNQTTLKMIAGTAIGVSLDESLHDIDKYIECQERLQSVATNRAYNPLLWYDSIFNRLQMGKQFIANSEFIHTFSQNLINERRKESKDELDHFDFKRAGLLDLLLNHQSTHNSIADQDIREDMNALLGAAYDTSSTSLTWALFFLGVHKKCQEKLIQEMNAIFGDDRERNVDKDDLSKMRYTECVIKESLRLYPPVALIGRATHADTVIGGHTFPKGTSVVISITHVHRDETVYANPTEFIPERFEGESKTYTGYMPFALGPRNCMGQRIAMTGMKIILAHIFRNFTVKSLDKESDIDFSVDVVTNILSPVRISFSKID